MKNIKQIIMKEIFRTVLINDKYKIAIGKHIASILEFDTIEEAQRYMDEKPWELILNVAAITSEFIINQKNEEK